MREISPGEFIHCPIILELSFSDIIIPAQNYSCIFSLSLAAELYTIISCGKNYYNCALDGDNSLPEDLSTNYKMISWFAELKSLPEIKVPRRPQLKRRSLC